MKIKIIVFTIALSLLLSGMLAAVGGEAIDGNEYGDESFEEIETQSAQEIHDWHDLDRVRDDLDGDYVLMNDLDEETDGYEDYNTEPEDYEAQMDAGIGGTWDDGDTIDIPFDEDDYDSVLSVEDEDGDLINHTIEEDTITIEEDTEERYLWVTYENALVGWEPLGPERGDSFTGNFDGNGYEISDLYVNRPKTDNVGLFGNVFYGEVTDVGLVDTTVSGDSGVGGVVGSNDEGTIENSHYNIDEVLINGENHVTIGGLFDEQYQDWIEDKELDITDYDETLVPSDDYYEISCVGGLRNLLGFAGREEYSFRLADDIDLSGEPDLYIPYLAADFYGNDHTISNLNIDMPFASQIGMFGYIIEETKVTNISMVEVDLNGNSYTGALVGYKSTDTIVSNSSATGKVSGEDYVGGLVGRNVGGTVSNSYAEGNVSGDYAVGGLVGLNWDDTVSNSYAAGDVSGRFGVGGLVGANIYGTVSNSYATGNVSGEEYVGGLVGHHGDRGELFDSYATGDVSGETYVGGLVGYIEWHTLSIGAYVSDSYATGDVSGEEYVGGLVGNNDGGTVENSYAAGNVSGDEYIGGLVGNNDGSVVNSFWDIETSGQNESDGGTGKSTAEMKNVATYTDTSTEGLDEPWNFVGNPNDDEGDDDIWGIYEDINDGYPFLTWEDVDLELYELTLSTEGEGSTDPEKGIHTYYEGDEVTVEATAEENWYFEEWTGDLESEEKEISIIMDEDKSITAHFEVEEYTLTVNTMGEGEVEIEPDQTEYEHGEEVDLTSVPHEGWEFEKWTGDVPEGEEEEDTINVIMDEDKEITAHFEEEDYDDDIPGFTSTLLLLAAVIAAGIYKKNER